MELKEIAEEIAKFQAKLKPVPPEMLEAVAPPEEAPPPELVIEPEAAPIEVAEEVCLNKQFLNLVSALPSRYVGESSKDLVEAMLESFSVCPPGGA